MDKPSKTKELFYLNTIVHIFDDSAVEIENCRKILEYNDIFLKIKTSTLILQIWGSNLRLDNYNTSNVVVRGKISSVEIIRQVTELC